MENQLPSAQPTTGSAQVTGTIQTVAPVQKSTGGTKEKFPDPLDKNPPAQLTTQSVIQDNSQLVNKRFWRTTLIFLVLLPIVTAISIFAYQTYLNFSLRSSSTFTPAVPTINPSQVVTPEMLPEVSPSAQLLPGWKRYTHPNAGYAFQYPEDWQVVDSNPNQVFLQSITANGAINSGVDDTSLNVEFNLLPINAPVVNNDQLIAFVKAQDQQEALRITPISDTTEVNEGGVTIYRRRVNKGTSLTNYPEAYVVLDKSVLQVTVSEVGQSTELGFDQIVQTIKIGQVAQSSETSQWKEYVNTLGYSLRHPTTIILRSNDKTEPGTSDASKALSISLFSAQDLQSGLSNSLTISLSESTPNAPSAQTGTRDFGTREFKSYESENQIIYVGQLDSGNWMEIKFSFNSNIDQRTVLSQIIDTIKLKESALP